VRDGCREIGEIGFPDFAKEKKVKTRSLKIEGCGTRCPSLSYPARIGSISIVR
jgi:hypothetical protein